MATYNLPDLRRSQLTAAGTITVPAGQTWIVKTANVKIQEVANLFDVRVVATIDGNDFEWCYYSIELIGLAQGYHIGRFSQSIIGSTVILNAGDTIVLTIAGGTVPILDIGYYILELDF